jgi:hypothetical protein
MCNGDQITRKNPLETSLVPGFQIVQKATIIPTAISFFWYAEKLDRKCTQNERSAGMTGKLKVHCIRFHTNMETKHLKKK